MCQKTCTEALGYGAHADQAVELTRQELERQLVDVRARVTELEDRLGHVEAQLREVAHG